MPSPDLERRLASLSPEKRALLSQRLSERPAAPAPPAAAPIAIVGMGCRFPGGADSPEAFWQLLVEGRNAVTEVPPGRWDAAAIYDPDPSVPGRTNGRHGGFLEHVDRFDAAFFGISPREASRMDPQQRLFLEVAWEAVDDAGLDMDRLAGTPTGVFVGLHGHASDYFWFDLARPERMDPFTGPGTAHNIVAGRLSYLYDLQGPSLVVDTACSSSLVAFHLACQSLRDGECTLALTGGVNLMLSPAFTIALSRLQMLSPDGRCRTFDADANGFVRAEGCGVVALKRLVDAQAAGDRILAVVRGSAVNQDGRTNGITAPNSQSQQRVISRALANAGVAASEVGFVEAHGTGTALGDPIEAEALAAVLGGAGRAPCLLGSAKANVGHMEGAAGIGGVIKAVLSLQHRAVPPLAHFRRLNPHVSLAGTRLEIPTTLRPWEPAAGTRIAGVSSFGWSGTNAHVILEEAPTSAAGAAARDASLVLPVSARSESALREMAARYRATVAGAGESDLADVCHSAAARRTHLDYRLAVAGASRDEIADGLDAYLAGAAAWTVATGRAIGGRRADAVFVFSGQGPQWPGMGQALFASEPAFRDRVTECSRIVETIAGWSLVDALSSAPASSRLQDTEVAQPALVALQLGVAALWASWGITPAAVVGHSVGEIAAAAVSGALGLEDALRIACHRGRLMQRATGHGRMVAVETTAADAARAIDGFGGRLSIAAVNAPRSCVLSGDAEPMDAAIASLRARGVLCRPLPVNYAFHSAQMESIAAELRATLGTVRSERPRVPHVSTVTGGPTGPTPFDADYWARNVRQPVLFARAIESLVRRGHRLFVEIGPHPVLASSIGAAESEEPIAVVPSLYRDRPEPTSMRAALGALYAAGHPIDWQRAAPAGRAVPLPRYAWQREVHWLPGEVPGAAVPMRAAARDGDESLGWPGRPVRSPRLAGHVFEIELGPDRPSWLRDYRVGGRAVVPPAVLLALGVSAAEHAVGPAPVLEDVSFGAPLTPADTGTCVVHTSVTPSADGGFLLEIHSLGADGTWSLHAGSRVLPASEAPQQAEAAESVAARCATEQEGDEFYSILADAGIDSGPSFRAVRRIRRRDGEVLATIAAAGGDIEAGGCGAVHPTVLEACLQPVLAGLASGDPLRGRPCAARSIGRVQILRREAGDVVSHVRLRRSESSRDGVVADVRLLAQDGATVALFERVVIAELSPDLAAPGTVPAYVTRWVPAPVPDGTRLPASSHWLVLADRAGVGASLAATLRARGHSCECVYADTAEAGADRAIDTSDPATVRDHLAGVLAGESAPSAIVCLWALDARRGSRTSAGEPERLQRTACGGALAALQALTGSASGSSPLLVVGTRRAQAIAPRDAVEPDGATLWGLTRVARLEHPDLQSVLVDIDSDGAAGAAALLAALDRSEPEPEIAVRDGRCYVPRLTALAGLETSSSATGRPGSPAARGPRVRSDATYLVTGGLGSLGLQVARWLASAGARHLVLTGRRAPGDVAAAAIAALQAGGVRVSVVRADVSSRSDVDRLLASPDPALPLAGIVHAAGVIDDGVVRQQEWRRVASVMAPKVLGAWNLHDATRGIALDFFVFFSSLSSVLGSPGQSNYAAANAFLDALAHQRAADGLPATSINWGPWGKGGMVEGVSARTAQRWTEQGVRAFTPEQGVAALASALGSGEPQVVVADVDWARYARASAAVQPLLAGLVPRVASPALPQPAGLHVRLALAAPGKHLAVVTEHVHATALQVLGLPATFPLDVHQGLRDAGLDSLMALELRNQLQTASGLRLSSTFAFDYPTVDAMARTLADLLGVTPAAAPIDAAPAGAAVGRADTAAAIGQISDAEAEALLRAELEAMAGGEPL